MYAIRSYYEDILGVRKFGKKVPRKENFGLFQAFWDTVLVFRQNIYIRTLLRGQFPVAVKEIGPLPGTCFPGL